MSLLGYDLPPTELFPSTTQALTGRYSLVTTVWVYGLTQKPGTAPVLPLGVTNTKPHFSDAIAAPDASCGRHRVSMSRPGSESIEIPVTLINRFVETSCLMA